MTNTKPTADALTQVLVQTFAMYYHAHAAHWNVMGKDFPQMHAFFGSLYEELHDAVDVLAEDLRTLGEFPPATLADLVSTLAAKERQKANATAGSALLGDLQADNASLLAALRTAYETAEAAQVVGIANRLQDRILAHEKHAWMLRATLS